MKPLSQSAACAAKCLFAVMQYMKKNALVFVALGIGGTPDNPQDLYFVPLDKMCEPVIVQSNISEFRSAHTHGRLFYKDYTGNITVLPPRDPLAHANP